TTARARTPPKTSSARPSRTLNIRRPRRRRAGLVVMRRCRPSGAGRARSEFRHSRVAVLVDPGDAPGVLAHGQGDDGRAALGPEEVQPLTGGIGEPDAPVAEAGGEQAVPGPGRDPR